MANVAIIPARGGSRGVPRKNLQPIQGIPLIGWSIRAALSAPSVTHVYVSTEDRQIAAEARKYGASVIDRPKALAGSDVTTLDVIHQVLGQVGEVGHVVCLECTSPFIESGDIEAALRLLEIDEADTVMAVATDHRFQLRFSASDELRGPIWITHDYGSSSVPRQKLPPIYRLAGGLFAWRWRTIVTATKTLIGRVRGVLIPEHRAIDIDSVVDLHLARALVEFPSHWIVVGSSPGAPDGLARVLASHPMATTITTNSGYELFPDDRPPDYYHLHDSIACREHNATARALKEKGTILTTLDRADKRALVSRGVEWFDRFFPLSGRDHPGKFERGKYASCGLSGLVCLQIALNHGAQAVHLVGMEGYANHGHYFGDRPDLGPEKSLRFTRNLIEPFVQSCIDACPDVEFYFYGDLNYKTNGRNVQCVN